MTLKDLGIKIVMPDKDALSTNVLYHQRFCNKFVWDYKPGKSKREAKGSVGKKSLRKGF